jgi:hypothetical protein
MSDLLYINDIPISEYGVILGDKSYKSVIQWASLKDVNVNNWAEYDYVEPDLSNPKLEKRSVILNFHATGVEGFESFLDILTENSLNTFYFPELGITLPMRVEKSSLSNVNEKWQSFSVTFSDDTPFVIQNPTIEDIDLTPQGYLLDDVDLSTYGVSILDGTLKGLREIGDIKPRLTISEKSKNGAFYDYESDVNINSNSIKLKCLIRAKTLKNAVLNYYSLLNDLIKPSERKIFIRPTAEVILCYYKSCSVSEVYARLASGLAGIAFEVTLELVEKGTIVTLARDDERYALTDEDGTYLIM